MNASSGPEFSWAEVCARRLQRHWLAAPSENGRPADIVRAMCGAHAQVITAAELSVGMRSSGTTVAEVRRALWDDATLVKAFGPRGTVHLLPADDLSLWTGALGAIPPAAHSGGFLTAAQTDEVVEAIDQALADGDLSVDELGEAVIGRTGAWAGELVMPAFQGMWPRWRAALATAGSRGVLCFGPNRGRLVTYRSPASMLPGFRPADAASALAWLVRSYLRAYGPATSAHFAQWLGVSRPWAAEVFDTLAGELAPATVEGAPAWVASGDTGKARAKPSGIRLLPYFDALRRRRPPPNPAVPRRGKQAGPRQGTGRQLSRLARGRRGWGRVAPASLGPRGRNHGRAVRQAAAGAGGGAGIPGGTHRDVSRVRIPPDPWPGKRRRPRLIRGRRTSGSER